MGTPALPRPTVEDAAVALVDASRRLDHVRAEADRIAAALEARWTANRMVRQETSWS